MIAQTCPGVVAMLASARGTPLSSPSSTPSAFEVGAEVREAFLAQAREAERPSVEAAFRPGAPGKYWADLYALARTRLARAGCTRVYGGDACTVADAARFYSYRRDRTTGRMATLVWLAA